MIEKTTDIILVITGFLLIVLSIALLTQKTKNTLSKKLLVAFLLTKTILILRWSFYRFGVFPGDSYYTYYISLAIFLLLAPILYLYIKSLCYRDYSIELSDSFHVIPFLLFALLMIINVYVQLNVTPENYPAFIKFLVEHDLDIFWGVNFIQILLYIILILKLLGKYRKEITNQYSSLDNIDLSWISTLIILISLHWLFVVSRGILGLFDAARSDVIKLLDIFSITIFLAFVTYLIFKGLNQLKIDAGIYDKKRSANSRLSSEETISLAEQVMDLMNSEKLHRTPSLTIVDIADKLSVPVWQLSQVINDNYEKNFFNFINSFRIDEAKELLASSGNGGKTVLEILYEVGFNSKSTFNSVFKSVTGMTPTEFKQTSSSN